MKRLTSGPESARPAPWEQRGWPALLLANVGLAVVYLVVAKLSLPLTFEQTHASPVWPPAGIALGALLVFGYRLWPAIALGTFTANVSMTEALGYSWPVSMAAAAATSAGTSLEAVIGTYLIRRYAGGRDCLERSADVARFVVLGGVLASLVSATVGVATECVARGAWFGAPAHGLTWWLGDAAAVLIVTPLLLAWNKGFRVVRGPRKLAELVLLAALVASLGAIVFIRNQHFEYLAIPLLLWAVFRFGPFETAGMIVLLSGIAIFGTGYGHGPFALSPVNESLLSLQAFIGVIAITTMLLSAVIAERRAVLEDLRIAVQRLETEIEERRRTNAALRDSEQRWRSLLQTVEVGVVIHDPATRVVAGNAAAQEVLGLTEQQMLGKTAVDPAWSFVQESGAAVPLELYPVNQVISTGRSVRNLVMGILRPDQPEITWALVHAKPVHDADGMLREVIVAFVDITERKQAEARIQEQLQELQRWYDVTLKREERVREMKREVNQLLARLGEPLRYAEPPAEVAPPTLSAGIGDTTR